MNDAQMSRDVSDRRSIPELASNHQNVPTASAYSPHYPYTMQVPSYAPTPSSYTSNLQYTQHNGLLNAPQDHAIRPEGSVASTASDAKTASLNRRESEGTASEPATDLAKQFACSTCGKGFARRSDLVRHERIHSGHRPHKCPWPYCDKQFIQRSALTVHERVHSGEKPHMCEKCSKQFSDSSSLARHRRIHSGKRPYQCPYPDCLKTFTRRTTLTRHQNNHSGTIEDATAARAAALAGHAQAQVDGPQVGGYDVEDHSDASSLRSSQHHAASLSRTPSYQPTHTTPQGYYTNVPSLTHATTSSSTSSRSQSAVDSKPYRLGTSPYAPSMHEPSSMMPAAESFQQYQDPRYQTYNPSYHFPQHMRGPNGHEAPTYDAHGQINGGGPPTTWTTQSMS